MCACFFSSCVLYVGGCRHRLYTPQSLLSTQDCTTAVIRGNVCGYFCSAFIRIHENAVLTVGLTLTVVYTDIIRDEGSGLCSGICRMMMMWMLGPRPQSEFIHTFIRWDVLLQAGCWTSSSTSIRRRWIINVWNPTNQQTKTRIRNNHQFRKWNLFQQKFYIILRLPSRSPLWTWLRAELISVFTRKICPIRLPGSVMTRR